MEKRITFGTKGQTLEGLYHEIKGELGLVVTHPHPLYGGDMTNPVVESVATVFARRNYSTLRFNFRGVGGSEGIHDNGDGEQDDIRSAIEFMIGEGKTSLVLAGYSFGTWVISRMTNLPTEVKTELFVSPPVAFIPFAENVRRPNLGLVVTGEEDDFGPPAMVDKMMAKWNSDAYFKVIDNADHFYFGSFRDLESELVQFIRTLSNG